MKSRGFYLFAGLWLGAIGAFCAFVAVYYLARSEVPSAVVALGGTVFCLGLVIPLFTTVPGRVTPRVESDPEGTTFRPDPAVTVPIQMAMVGALVSCVLILILLPTGKLAIPVPPNMRYALPFSAAFVVVFGIPAMWRNLRRGSTSYLRLMVDGFEVAQGWQKHTALWSAVKDIASEAPNQKTPTPGVIVFVMADDAVWTLTALAFTPGGAALRDLVRLFWQHPEYRDELIDGRAAARLDGVL